MSAGVQSGTGEPLKAGMILSNEPGYYKAGAFGIRIENLVLVQPRAVNGGEKPMLGFETLTFAPLERELIALDLLRDDEIAWVDAYHAEVLNKIGPHLDGDDLGWLADRCTPL
jgi:Xaa-Pro aminopeptidase